MGVEATASLESTSYFDIDNAFLQKVLKPYRSHSCYLKKSRFHLPESSPKGITIDGEFEIDESCYIDDTGHFNAVEYNICYNQIAYVHLGYSIQNGLIPELADYDTDSFFEKQLSHFLIAQLQSSYQSQLNARRFYGTFGINAIKKTSKCTFLKTYCHFHDGGQGKSKGEVTLAVLSPNVTTE